MTGTMGRVSEHGIIPPEPIPDFPGFVASLTAKGCTRNPCRDHCPDKADEHVHMRHQDGHDGIIWADGRVSEWDLTQPARLIYPAPFRNLLPRSAASHDPPGPFGECYAMASGTMVHVRPGCRCKT